MATYKQIQDLVKVKHGRVMKTCWIAHVKDLNGLAPRVSHRRAVPGKRQHPCPSHYRPLIESAMRQLGML